jgi:hypothetical protein
MRHLQHIRQWAQAPTFTSPIASGNGQVMLCRNPRMISVAKGSFGAGNSRARDLLI